MSDADGITVYFNPRCSKCRKLRELLEERGVAARYRLYLEEPPTVEELGSLLEKLGVEDPAAIMRSKEAAWSELGLRAADAAKRLAALAQHPQLLERPILVRGQRAVVARPPEKALELL